MLAFLSRNALSFYNSFSKRTIITTATVKKFKNTQFFSSDNYGAEDYSGIAGRVEVVSTKLFVNYPLNINLECLS